MTHLQLRSRITSPLALAVALTLLASLLLLPTAPATGLEATPGAGLTVTLRGDSSDGKTPGKVWSADGDLVILQTEADYELVVTYSGGAAGDVLAINGEEVTDGFNPQLSTDQAFAFQSDDKESKDAETLTVSVTRGDSFALGVTFSIQIVKAGAKDSDHYGELNGFLYERFGTATIRYNETDLFTVTVRGTRNSLENVRITTSPVCEQEEAASTTSSSGNSGGGNSGGGNSGGGNSGGGNSGGGACTERPNIVVNIQANRHLDVALASDGSKNSVALVVDAINGRIDLPKVDAALLSGQGATTVSADGTFPFSFALDTDAGAFATLEATGVTKIATGPALPPPPAPADTTPQPLATPPAPGSAVFLNAAGEEEPTKMTIANGQAVISAGGFDATVAGDLGATPTTGPLSAVSGTFQTSVTGPMQPGGVIEAWMFSTPRLVAAGRIDSDGTVFIDLPLNTPLDGGEPIPAGPHTVLLRVPAAAGGTVQFFVAVTVSGPTPTSVPAGEGSMPLMPVGLAVLAAVGSGVLVAQRGRRGVPTPA